MGGSMPAERGTIAQRLDELISSRHPDGHGPSSYEEIARASREHARMHGGPTISHQGVLNIRSGKVTNPGVDSLQALANVYGVDITYFFETSTGQETGPAANPEEGGPGSPALPPAPALAARLNLLFSVVQPNGRPPLTDQAAAEAATAGGTPTSAAQIAALRAGALDGLPDDSRTPARLARLADVFGVPSAYFFDEEVAARVAEDLAILKAFKDVGARRIALRAVAALDEEALSALVPMIEHLRRASKRQRL